MCMQHHRIDVIWLMLDAPKVILLYITRVDYEKASKRLGFCFWQTAVDTEYLVA